MGCQTEKYYNLAFFYTSDIISYVNNYRHHMRSREVLSQPSQSYQILEHGSVRVDDVLGHFLTMRTDVDERGSLTMFRFNLAITFAVPEGIFDKRPDEEESQQIPPVKKEPSQPKVLKPKGRKIYVEIDRFGSEDPKDVIPFAQIHKTEPRNIIQSRLFMIIDGEKVQDPSGEEYRYYYCMELDPDACEAGEEVPIYETADQLTTIMVSSNQIFIYEPKKDKAA